MPIRSWNGFSSPLSRHSVCRSRIRRCIAIAMLTQAMASSLTPLRLRVAKEGQDRIADILVNGRAVLQRDLRHLRQIAVEQAVSSSDSRSSVVSVKSAMSEKNMVSFLRLEAIFTSCVPANIDE